MTNDLFETLQALFEGLALIASPCILPILPLMLSGSLGGGKGRPYGIVVGFVLAFSLFTYLTRAIIAALGIDPEIIRQASLILLALFGAVLLSTRLSERFARLTQGLAQFGNKAATHQQGGFGGGVVIGALIALVWTPCAGPILAAVLVQVIRQQSDIQSLIMIAAFAFGAALPMLAVALLGRRAVKAVSVLARHTGAIRRIAGAVILLSVAFIASGATPQALFNSETTVPAAITATPRALQDGLSSPYPAPEFVGLTHWINSKPLTISALKGKVVLIDFWTYSCINCVRTLPYLTAWDKKYRADGLVVIGISAPEFEFEKNPTNVAAAVRKDGIAYPVALDNNLQTWTQYNNRYWPAHYLIDRNGDVVYTHFGEGAYARTENNIRFLLGLNPAVPAVPTQGHTLWSRWQQTPETYLGYRRMERYTGKPSIVPDMIADYTLPASLPADNWALDGAWKVESDRIVAQNPGSTIRLHFTAGKVYLVLGTADGNPIQAHITLNGKPVGPHAGKDAPGGIVTVNRDTLYQLINQGASKGAVIDITAKHAGLEAYAFTFGE